MNGVFWGTIINWHSVVETVFFVKPVGGTIERGLSTDRQGRLDCYKDTDEQHQHGRTTRTKTNNKDIEKLQGHR